MSENTWKILIVDDEPEIHTVTKLVMGRETIFGRRLEFLDAVDGTEAREILKRENDIALVLLDVVMRTDSEGLELVRWIREELGNSLVRIVLRTGNPGEAPEMAVITGYDINDYKEKSELTAKKLRTLFYTLLRSYRDITALDQCRNGLIRIISALAQLYVHPTLEEFTGGVLEQIGSYLFLNHGALYGISSGLGAFHQLSDGDYHIVAATGEYSQAKGKKLSEVLSPEILNLAAECGDEAPQVHRGNVFVQCMAVPGGGMAVLILEGVQSLTGDDRYLLRTFSENAARAFRNLAERLDACRDTE